MQPIATDNVLINGSRIAYKVLGSGEPVVLLHGTPSSSLIWRNIAPKLVSAGYKVHLFDLLGYGVSERPWDSNIDTSISGQLPILEGLLDYWGLDRINIIAHDFGGGIAQRFCVFHPERIVSLVLIDVVSFDSYPSPRTREQMKDGLENLIKTSDGDHRTHFKNWLLTAVYSQEKFDNSVLNTYLEYISGPVGQASLFQHQISQYDPKHTMEVSDKLHELGRLPVKLIWGKDDHWQVIDWAHKLNKAIPGSELEIFENCGHFSPEDQPEKLADRLLQFLGENN